MVAKPLAGWPAVKKQVLLRLAVLLLELLRAQTSNYVIRARTLPSAALVGPRDIEGTTS